MSKKLLVIGSVWPEPSTTAAGCRMQQLLGAFLRFGYKITFASTASRTEYSLDLEKVGVAEVTIQLNHSSFDDFIKKLLPTIVIFDRFMIEEQFGWRVAEFAPKALRILNTEDLHALRKAREEASRKQSPFVTDHWKNHPMTLRETASIYRCDLSLIISTYEMEILQKELHIPSELLMHLPFMVDVSTISKEKFIPFDDRKGFISIGNGKHAPNVDAIKVLKQEIWPSIRKELPDAEIHIYGAYLPQQVSQMHHPKSGFYVKGWTENVDVVLNSAKVLLAPLQFGAGIKGKLMDAMRTGTPSVTTTVGAEGMHKDLPWNGAITNNWKAFAQISVKLHQSKDLWETAQEQGLELLQTIYNRAFLQDRLEERVNQIRRALETHREQNFIGKLLQHQTMMSTKYMAKWIEAKNKSCT
ncbi:MAG TPA: glycosyltransferase [Muricauda sp.]|uniref:Glycosyltransferase n=1 Tax=Flagellimonas aurea TaxID=2915619 RepID=A0ABS3G0Z6_9FLAO|nr:glycosyltransferase [Allomuricauda aurea]MAO16756.1 glycosyltransferase [Allomuricauda sp.]MBO0353073.1 glycosyltransferase [Allomuricauda aurea]HBU77311.1 glycosyltransferase [Allomuricauda sp.]